MMELKIYNPPDDGFVQKIEWNFEELKADITAAAEGYAVSVYTDETIRQARADRAKLNRFVDALKGTRTKIRKKLLEPDEQFGREVQELSGIAQRAIDNIDSQVKDYERRQREEKTAKIREFYEDNIHDIGKYLPFERVMKPEYALASTSMKSVKENVLALIQRVDEGLAILNEVDSRFAGDMKKVFLQTYDIGAAMAERNRLETDERNRQLYMEEQERIKKQREEQEKADARNVMEAGRSPEPSKADETSQAEDTLQEKPEEQIYMLDFRVYATMAQLAGLKQYLKDNGIRFEPVPKQ